jgi:hypothetical protein
MAGAAVHLPADRSVPGTESPRGTMIHFPLTHEDLGFLTGAHRVSIICAMKRSSVPARSSTKIESPDKPEAPAIFFSIRHEND